MRFFKRALKDESGVTIVVVALSMVMIFAFAVLTIDLSFMQLAKTQLQNAADASALAGALALAASNGDQDVAREEAKNFAALNVAVQDKDRPVVINDSDVEFLPVTDPTKVRVTTRREDETAVILHFLKVINPSKENLGNMTADATAAVYAVTGPNCLRPWCPPDRWDDADGDSTWDPADEYTDVNGNGVWDSGEPLTTDGDGDGVWDPAELYDPYLTGYGSDMENDLGTQVILKLRNSKKSPRMGWYYAVCFGPINTGDPVHTGGEAYRTWIGEECEPYAVHIGDQLQIEPGNMVGPTNQGLQYLIDLDPTAEWDPVTRTVINSALLTSPRIIICGAFDPTVGVQSDVHGRDYVTISKIMVFFVEAQQGSGEVVGRFMRKATEGDICEDCPIEFLYAAVLIE